MEIIKNSNIENLKRQSAFLLYKLFNLNKKKPILFLTSGGSALDILDNLRIPDETQVSIGVLDERYSTDPLINNFDQLKKTPFFNRSKKLFEHILDTSVFENESLEDFTDRYESFIRSWMVENKAGIIIATVGMGSDGHVSGIMPFSEDESKFERLFNDGHHLVVGYDAGDKNLYKKRSTTTMEFMRRIHHAIAYIVSEKKHEAWNRVVAEKGTLAKTPARILKEMESVTVFTDLD